MNGEREGVLCKRHTDLAAPVALGGDCLANIAVLRDQLARPVAIRASRAVAREQA